MSSLVRYVTPVATRSPSRTSVWTCVTNASVTSVASRPPEDHALAVTAIGT
ncbi:hypothetical protein [Mumia quercus]|uniref:hypothetical protein n=1 Tax=Mumia quercus TaxID=2976125 RepID=UPI0021D3A03E|nr:hypothetical protein [Mumia quercus]